MAHENKATEVHAKHGREKPAHTPPAKKTELVYASAWAEIDARDDALAEADAFLAV